MQRLAQVIVAGTILSGQPPPQFAPRALVAWSEPGLGLSSPRPRIPPGGFTQISFTFSLAFLVLQRLPLARILAASGAQLRDAGLPRCILVHAILGVRLNRPH